MKLLPATILLALAAAVAAQAPAMAPSGEGPVRAEGEGMGGRRRVASLVCACTQRARHVYTPPSSTPT